MEQLLDKDLECSEGTIGIAQWRSQLRAIVNKRAKIETLENIQIIHHFEKFLSSIQ